MKERNELMQASENKPSAAIVDGIKQAAIEAIKSKDDGGGYLAATYDGVDFKHGGMNYVAIYRAHGIWCIFHVLMSPGGSIVHKRVKYYRKDAVVHATVTVRQASKERFSGNGDVERG